MLLLLSWMGKLKIHSMISDFAVAVAVDFVLDLVLDLVLDFPFFESGNARNVLQ